MLELYHNAMSTCSQKVRLVLAEKELEFTSHEIDLLSGAQHDPSYAALNPHHVVPTLVHDGVGLIESTLINEYLDDAFPSIPMRPADALGRHALRLWTKLLDEQVQAAIGVLTYAIAARPLVLQQAEEVREANIGAIPDAARRAARRSVIAHGVQAPEFAGALEQLIDLIDRAETALANREWLSGADFGLADAGVLPYVLRLDTLAMTPLLTATARPHLAAWFGRMQARPSFETAVRRWVPDEIVELFRGVGASVWSEVEPLTKSEGS